MIAVEIGQLTTATLTLHGRVKIGGDQIGVTVGENPDEEAFRVLRAHGYIAVGEWTEDAHYDKHVPVEYHGITASILAVEAAAERIELCQQALEDAQSALAAIVRATLLAGVPAKDIAHTLGVSRTRVYQIRDERR